MKLYPHQEEALNLTKNYNRVAYYYDMGLGKTFIGSEKLKQLNEKSNVVVCQASKLDDWTKHFEQHYPKYNIIYDIEDIAPYPAVLIISYDTLKNRPAIKKWSDYTLLLDESSAIQHETSKRTKFILKLTPKNVILLSGTPTNGKYENLYSQIKLLGWNISKTQYWNDYIQFHRNLTQYGFPYIVVTGYKNVADLKFKLKTHGALFKKAEDVGITLPEKNEIIVNCEPHKKYKEFIKNSICDFPPNLQLIANNSLVKLLYCRHLTGMYSQHKLEQLQSLIESTDDRLIVFYNFEHEFEEIKKLIDKPISIINGKIKDLHNYDNYNNSITLIQYQAGAMGLNLQKANKVIFFTPPLSCELFEQAHARIRRIGQTRPCFYWYLVCNDTVEADIYKNLKQRKEYTDELFESYCQRNHV